MKKSAWAAVALVLGASSLAPAATIVVNFNDADGVASSLWYGKNGSVANETYGGSNTGAEPSNRAYLTRPDVNDDYPVALYRPNLPADLIGGTVHSATFTVTEAFFNGGSIGNVQLHRVNVPGASTTWDPGTGSRATRFSLSDGVLRYWADYDHAAGSGIDWAGNAVTGPWNGGSTTDFQATAMADLIDAETFTSGTGAPTVWDVTTLVQNWANGTWENDGFALQTFDGTGTSTAGYQLRTDGTLGDGTPRGLVIEYTPVPEPASLGLLAGAATLLLGRRRRNG